MLDFCTYFLGTLAEATLIWEYSTSLFSQKYSDRIKGLSLAVSYFILFLLSFTGKAGINIVAFLLINYIFLYTQHKLKRSIALFHSAIITTIMSMSELVVYCVLSLITPDHHLSPFQPRLDPTVFSKTVYFIIAYTLSHFFSKKEKSTAQQIQPNVLFIFIPLISLAVMFPFINMGEAGTSSSINNWLLAISSILILLMNLLIFWINQYTRQKNIDFTEKQVLLQKEYDSAEYYKMLLQQNENQSILIHDIKKHLQTIELLNEKKDFDKIKAYIHQLLKASDLKEFSRICDHEMLNVILSRYKRQCSNKNIDFIADIRNGTTGFIPDSDLTALFCNLLDNAMEAAEGIPGGYIEINVSKKKPTDFVVLSVINSCRYNPFAADSHSLVTRKADKKRHGFGIKSIRKVAEKYHGDMQMYYDDDALTFHSIITLVPPKKWE